MVDVAMVAIILAFFAVAIALVKACERILGPDIESSRAGAASEPGDDEVAA